MRKWLKKRGTLLAAGVVVAALALDVRLTVQRYALPSDKLTAPVRLALVTDLHSCRYGKNQSTLINALAAEAPDLVLFSGDIFDDDLPPGPAMTFLEAAADGYPCYYVAGNHEFRRGDVDELKASLRALGVTVLEGDCLPVSVRGQTLNLCGVDDPSVGKAEFQRQLEQTEENRVSDAITLLLSHRPERIDQYGGHGYDLVLSGHAHGGQWRIPLLLNGLIAPHQGLFPKYAGGLYQIASPSPASGSALLISRGLARESTLVPRIFNRPELVILELEPDTSVR